VKIPPTVTPIMAENNDLVNNFAVQKLINQAVIRTLANYNAQLSRLLPPAGFPDPADPAGQQNSLEQQSSPGPAEPAGNNISEDNVIFRVSDLGYFHPDLEKFYNHSDNVTTGKKTIYREIYTFCRRVGDYASTVGKKKIRNHISTCFRDNALY